MNKEKIQTVLERTFEPKFLFDGKKSERVESKKTRYTIVKDVKTMNEF